MRKIRLHTASFRKNYLLVSALLLGIVLFISCKKKDNSPPDIVIVSPLGLPSYSVPEEIFIEADISDNQSLEWVKIDVVRPNNSRVSGEIFIQLDGKTDYLAQRTILLDDLYLESGNYFIRVRAFDGHNESTAFREILVDGVPKALNSVYLVKQEGNQFQLDFLDSDGNINSGIVLDGSAVLMSTNSKDQEILLGSLDPEEIITIKSSDLTNVSVIQILSDNSSPFFLDVFYSELDFKNYFAVHTGRIIVVTENSNLSLNFEITDGFRPQKICVDDQFIIVHEQSFDGSINNVALYYKNSGVFFGSASFNFDLINFVCTGSRIFIIGNQDGEAIISELNTETFLVNEIELNLGNGPCFSVAGTENANEVFVSYAAITLRYSIQSVSANTTGSWAVSLDKIQWNAADNNMYGLNSTGLVRLNNGGETTVFPETSDYDLFSLMFNK